MDDRSFNALASQITEGVSRRMSLAALGAAGLAAIARPLAVTAKGKNQKKNRANKNKKAKRECQEQLAECTSQSALCAAQVEQCTAVFNSLCAGDPACLDQAICCPSLGSCDITGFIACISASG